MVVVSRRLHNGRNSVIIHKKRIKNKIQHSFHSNQCNFERRCHQLLVNYSKIPFTEWQTNPPDLDKFEWDVAGTTRLLINSEGCVHTLIKIKNLNSYLHLIFGCEHLITTGCGYPPHVNCTEFAKKYG